MTDHSVPFRDRVGASVTDTVRFSGIKRTTLCALIKAGELESKLVKGRRIVLVRSVLRLLGERSDKEVIS